MEDLNEEEEWEYPLSVFNKIFYSLLATGILVFSLYLVSLPSKAGLVFSMTVVSVLILLAGLIILTVVRRKLVINKDSIVYTSLFSTRELPIQAVLGYRVSPKVIVIESSSAEYRRIYLGNYIDLANSRDIRQWVTTNFKDLNAEDLAASRQQILEDPALGNSQEEREQKLKQAKTVAILYNVISVLTSFIMLFFSSAFSNISMLLLPWIGVALLFSNKGLIKLIGAVNRNAHPHVFLGIIFPSFFLLIKALNAYNVLKPDHIWLPAFFVATLLIIPMYFRGINAAGGNLAGQVIFLLLTGLLYGFGSTRLVNCAFDKKPAELYQAAIFKHWTTTGKRTNYFIKLSPWGPQTTSTRVEIGKKLFYNTAAGDTVIINLKPGLLQIPWYVVEKREDNTITERNGDPAN